MVIQTGIDLPVLQIKKIIATFTPITELSTHNDLRSLLILKRLVQLNALDLHKHLVVPLP